MKINYGIYFNDSFASIARIEGGNPCVVKSDLLKDTTPLAVAFNRKGNILIGDSAYASYRSDSMKSLAKNAPLNSFVEFKRTLGTNCLYYSSNLDKSFSSEELLAEVFKRLKEYVIDDLVNAVVITVPAAFKSNQIDAVKKAGEIAGFHQIEILQEPVAAAMAYSINSTNKDAFWLVFDYQKGTFDTALLKIEEGIMKVIDTEGDNYLGGVNLDYTVVDQLIIPNIQENYEIDGVLSDDAKKAEYRGALKFFAEEIKKNLSLNTSYNIYADLGEVGKDDNGEEIEIDLMVTQHQLKEVLAPAFQKVIDISLQLLTRNNLTGKALDRLILVGSDTLSPILRAMIDKQILKPDTNRDPETVIVIGAALYASTVELYEEIKDQTRDKTKIQLEIGYEASTVEMEEFVTVKILEDKTEGTIPEKVFAEIKRGDNAWASGKIEIDTLGEVIEAQLTEGKTNVFDITLYDDKGNLLECEPNSFNVIQGSVVGSATLPYNVGIEIQDINTGKVVFRTIQGLEKNKSLPATGTINGLKTDRPIRPGMESDYFELSLFQGEHGADETRAIHNHHVNTIYITGNDLPCILPEGSDIDISISIDKSQKLTGKAYFPAIDFECDFECETAIDHVETAWLDNEFKKALSSVNELKRKGVSSEELDNVEKEIQEGKKLYESSKDDTDTKQQALSNLRKSLKVVDKLLGDSEWPELEKELKEAFHNLEEINREKGNEQTTQIVNKIKPDVEQAIRDKDSKNTPQLIEIINHLKEEVLKIKVSICKSKVEDLLFALTEDEKIPADKFGVLYEQLSSCTDRSPNLEMLHEEIKGYE